jgi:pimeloyl-ACP methyl ester carboxylesterase
VKRGVEFTARNLRYDVIDGSILENVTTIQVPVYFFSGRFDYTDPTVCTMRLFEKISAPLKKIVWFEHSAHFVFLEEPSRFAAEMRGIVQETNAVEKQATSIKTHEHAGDFKEC